MHATAAIPPGLATLRRGALMCAAVALGAAGVPPTAAPPPVPAQTKTATPAKAPTEAKPPGAAPAPAPAPAPAHVEQVRKARAESLLGQPVTDTKGEVFGHIVDVLIDADGAPHAAVVEFTGFFGIGDRRVAVAWQALHFAVQQDHIAISTSLDQAALKAMPEYKQADNSVPVAMPAPAAPKPH